MAIPVIMPRQGQSVETCIITRWFRTKGEKVSAGDLLFSYETDKASFELESPADGILLETFFGEGSEVPVLVNVAVIGKEGEPVEEFIPGGVTAKPAAVEHDAIPAEKVEIKAAQPEKASGQISSGDRIRISPRAKKLAENKGLNFGSLTGTGPNGRIVVNDIEALLSGKAVSTIRSGSEFSEKPITNVRRIIAKSMHASLQNSAQLTHHMSADVRRLLETRQKVKKDLESGKSKADITLNDMVCWCVIKALQKFPEANSHFLGESIRTFNRVHLGLAVDTQRGLMVPALKNADTLTIQQLSVELKKLAESCKKGNIDPGLLQSNAASFTVSNLGNYGVEMFTPVINLPQAAILGVCTIINRPADLGNNIFGFVPYMGLSLTYDHRAIDGGPATLFLREIKNQIESFVYSNN
jgi:pyruvate dehydrogenase E2 component (dihydrolipoamide acetyltransferase)